MCVQYVNAGINISVLAINMVVGSMVLESGSDMFENRQREIALSDEAKIARLELIGFP
jgi:hypothetical protein